MVVGEAINYLNGVRSSMRDEHTASGAVDIAMVKLARPVACWRWQIDIPTERQHSTTPSLCMPQVAALVRNEPQQLALDRDNVDDKRDQGGQRLRRRPPLRGPTQPSVDADGDKGDRSAEDIGGAE